MRKVRIERNSALFTQEVDSFSAREPKGRRNEGATYPETPPIVIDRDVRKVRLEFTITQHLSESDHSIPVDRNHRVTPGAVRTRNARSRSAAKDGQPSAVQRLMTPSRCALSKGRSSGTSPLYKRRRIRLLPNVV